MDGRLNNRKNKAAFSRGSNHDIINYQNRGLCYVFKYFQFLDRFSGVIVIGSTL